MTHLSTPHRAACTKTSGRAPTAARLDNHGVFFGPPPNDLSALDAALAHPLSLALSMSPASNANLEALTHRKHWKAETPRSHLVRTCWKLGPNSLHSKLRFHEPSKNPQMSSSGSLYRSCGAVGVAVASVVVVVVVLFLALLLFLFCGGVLRWYYLVLMLICIGGCCGSCCHLFSEPLPQSKHKLPIGSPRPYMQDWRPSTPRQLGLLTRTCRVTQTDSPRALRRRRDSETHAATEATRSPFDPLRLTRVSILPPTAQTVRIRGWCLILGN